MAKAKTLTQRTQRKNAKVAEEDPTHDDDGAAVMNGAPGASLVRGDGGGGAFGDAVLGLPVADGGADGVLCQHRAVDLHRRERELLDDVGVGDGEGLGDGLALDPLGGE